MGKLFVLGTKFPFILYFQKITEGFPLRKDRMGRELRKEKDIPSHIEEQIL